ncbi:MAG: ABC-F family ATP-binding cassette domain-containing protein [Muribaculaceae bacterium]|nr:ABC-F family ATP-binding cassette domain-containing protein [Muribaculaceae bacterium]
MESYLQLDSISKAFGADELLTDVTFSVAEGEKIGLIAKNGSGKTTLLNIIAGIESPDSGTIVTRRGLRIGYLQQLPSLEGDTVMACCPTGHGDGWDVEQQFKKLLTMLKIDDLSQPVSQLSGGQVKRVALAQLLLHEPQLLILDEPTNHLDIDIIEWLENYLQRSRMTLLMVTHDRYFLDTVCNRILEIDQHRVYSYDGNYDYYLAKRAERLEAQSVQAERARNLLRTELEWMRRQPQARAHKAQYRIDAFYDLQERAAQRRDDSEVQLNVKSAYIGKKIFIAHDVSKRWGDKVILDHFNYTFARYEKLGIVGDNGVGKSTFLRLLLGELQPDEGHFEVGETVRWGYYSQQGIEFDPGQRVIDAVRDVAEYIYFDEKTHYTAAQFLNLFLFSPRDQLKPIAKLSGGERRRLYLATVLMRKPNFLILDEPTNDLDIATLEILEDYLAHFGGCVIIVSHDRFFMDRTVDHTFVMLGNGHIKDFPGNYSEYRAWVKAHETPAAASAPKPASQRRPDRERAPRLTYKERKELEQLTATIEQLTAERDSLDALFAGGQPIDDIHAQATRYQQLKQELDEAEMRWLELTEKDEASKADA